MKEKLCYVDGAFAYFTTQPLEKQWGDDWDDAPYEHNAGTPYGPREGENFEIIKVAFDGPFVTPAYGFTNSYFSVEQINAGHAPWLRDEYGPAKVAIPAGVSIAEFSLLVRKAGGNVYLAVGERAELSKEKA